jgi:hypothetical protein
MSLLSDHSRQAAREGRVTRTHAAISRLLRLLAELHYAQWRLLEIRTGLVLTPETEHALVRAQIDRLNALYEA